MVVDSSGDRVKVSGCHSRVGKVVLFYLEDLTSAAMMVDGGLLATHMIRWVIRLGLVPKSVWV